MSEVTIRIATPEDAKKVSEIAKICWAPIYDGFREQLGDVIYDTLYEHPLEDKGEKVASAVLDGRAFVAVCDGVVCGFATYEATPPVGALKDNAVHPDYKGRAIASLLYERVFSKLRELGCTVCRVMTGLDDAHASARRAYQKAGFERSRMDVTYFMEL